MRAAAVQHRVPCTVGWTLAAPAGVAVTSHRGRARRGFSLLELILALAILALSVAAISQLVRLGLGHARHARELTKAELYCESTLAELAAGVIPLEGATDVPVEQDSDWLYSVTVEPAPVNGLLVVTVTVYQAEPDPVRPIEMTLVRWMADPAMFSTETAGGAGLGDANLVGRFASGGGGSGSLPSPSNGARIGWARTLAVGRSGGAAHGV